MKAFIFSSSTDEQAARLCAARLRLQGAEAQIVFDQNDPPKSIDECDIVSSFARNGRLFGAECSAGMASIMASHSNGHAVLAKVDADMVLSDAGFEWVAGASDRAHGFSLGRRSKWCGLWAAPAMVFPVIAKRLPIATGCTGCPESHLFYSFFRAHCGIRRMNEDKVQIWRSGRPVDQTAMVVTLPSGLSKEPRIRELEELFSLVGSHQTRIYG